MNETRAKLTPETIDLEDGPDEDSEPVGIQTSEVPDVLEILASRLEQLSLNPRVVRNEGRETRVVFELPAGQSSRDIYVDASSAPLMLDEFSHTIDWRSLQRYDGVWSKSQNALEVALQFDRFSPNYLPWMRPYRGQNDAEDDVLVLRSTQGVTIRIGEASMVARLLLSSASRRRLYTMRISGIAVTTSADADTIAEELGDAISFTIRMNYRTGLQLRRLRNNIPRYRRRGVTSEATIKFPSGKYPHAPILMYHAGRDRWSSPLIRYWALYQVLEYFFPRFTRREALEKLSIRLRAPNFNPYDNADIEDVLKVSSLADTRAVTERDQLAHTIRAITGVSEVVELVETLELEEHLKNRKSELTGQGLRIGDENALLDDLANRIYDIRCRIVHSKYSGMAGLTDSAGLIPGTHHDDLVMSELPIMEFLAERAIVASSEALYISHAAAD